ncbi:MAG TPA: rhodanese-like domain-containing protein [Granulicella sp.]|nr:rhodanese-like domain-containing protein [Granulicella sp.]
MIFALLVLAVLATVAALFVLIKRRREREEIDRYSISPEELHALMDSGQTVNLFDVRQPLDLLAYTYIIPGSQRIPPDDILANPKLIPSDQDAIIYCTCPSDRTSRRILHLTRSLNFTRIKFLRGGLGAWKERGFLVEPYTDSFRLDTAIREARGRS